MASTVDWGTRVITVYQADLIYLSGVSYQLDTEAFKIELRELESSQQGEVHPVIVNHATSVTLDGIDYARIIEIINGYTITFEETGTPYKVFLKGSNNNILTVTNLGTVQVAPSNSAGLINVTEVQHDVFNGAVHIDQVNGSEGTIYPIGTPLKPAKSFPDAVSIAYSRGFDILHVIGNATLDTGDDISGYKLVGQNAAKTIITVNENAQTLGCEIIEASITGNLDGGTILRNCVITNLNYINGFVYNCMVNDGVLSLGGSYTANFLNCYSGVAGVGTPTIDMNGVTDDQDTPLAVRGYNGGIKIIEKTGSGAVSIDLASGQVVIDSSCVNGSIVVRGDGKVIDENGNHINSGTINGNLVLLNEANYGEHVHDMWQLMGLDDTNPVTGTSTQTSVGNIILDVDDLGNGNGTITRQ